MGVICDNAVRTLGIEKEIQKVDLSGLEVLKGKGMTFRISAWDHDDLRISSIDMSGMLGLMKMESVIITASGHDVPLFNIDFVKAANKKTMLAELYDTMISREFETDVEKGMLVKKKFDFVENYPRQSRWYDPLLLGCSLAKRDKVLDDATVGSVTRSYVTFYKEWYERSAACEPAEKLQKTRSYVDGLLSQGGASTDQFKNMFGPETTEKLFRILFGVR